MSTRFLPQALVLATCLVLAGCKYKQQDFANDYASSSCQLYEDCAVLDQMGFETREACVAVLNDEYNPATGACDGYEPEQAELCVQQIDQLSCEQLYDDVTASACDAVCGGV